MSRLWTALTFILALFTASADGVPVTGGEKLPPGKWVVLNRGTIRIFHEVQDSRAAEGLAILYEDNLGDFAAKLGLALPNRVTIFIAPNEARFRYMTRGLPEWAGGAVYPEKRLVILQSPRLYIEKGRFLVNALHEGVHLLTELGGELHLPRWLSEGLAMYLSGETLYKRRTPLGRAVVLGKTYTLEEIDDMLRLGPQEARVAYLQSISAVEFLVENWGWPSIARLVHGYRNGENPDEMFRDFSGRDMFTVEAAWHRELRRRYRWYNLLQWLDVDMIIWYSATFLVIVAGGLAIRRRRKYIKSMEDSDDWTPPGTMEPPLSGEEYLED